MTSDAAFAEITEQFSLAGLVGAGWPEALSQLAQFCGGWGAHLLSAEPGTGTTANIIVNHSPEQLREFEERGGVDPNTNPRAQIVEYAPGTILLEPEMIAEEDRLRSPIYAEFLNKTDAPYSMTSLLERNGDATTVLCLSRTDAQGAGNETERETLRRFLPYVTGAMSIRRQLAADALRNTLWGLEQIHATALICDGNGQIQGASENGETLLRSGELFEYTRGRIEMSRVPDLKVAVQCACNKFGGPLPPPMSVAVDGASGRVVARVTVSPLPPQQFTFCERPLALLTVDRVRSVALGRLTQSERAICALLLAGKNADEIAVARNVSPHTVRAQLKAVYSKFGVRGRAELILALR